MEKITPLTKTKLRRITFWTKYSSIIGMIVVILCGCTACSPALSTFFLKGGHPREIKIAFYLLFFATIWSMFSVIAYFRLFQASKNFSGYDTSGSSEFLVSAFKHIASFWKFFTISWIVIIITILFFYSIFVAR
ncbi:MAG: DUF5362 family protein [Saprospiraceae bacterium]|nr:DUF5362 family protein [Saprospiraceae bacterium]